MPEDSSEPWRMPEDSSDPWRRPAGSTVLTFIAAEAAGAVAARATKVVRRARIFVMRVMSVSFDLRLAVCEPSEGRLGAGRLAVVRAADGRNVKKVT